MDNEEAIKYFVGKYFIKKAKEFREDAEIYRPMGERIASPLSPYNPMVKEYRDKAVFYEQVAEWITNLKDLKESELSISLSRLVRLMKLKENPVWLGGTRHMDILLTYEEENVVREYLIEHFGLERGKGLSWSYPMSWNYSIQYEEY